MPNSLPCPRVHGPQDANLTCDLAKCPQDSRQHLRIIHIRGAMQCDECERRDSETLTHAVLPKPDCLRLQFHKRVDHDVADEMNSLVRDSLATEVFVSIARGCE